MTKLAPSFIDKIQQVVYTVCQKNIPIEPDFFGIHQSQQLRKATT
jgi:hypothetical protein